MELRTVRFFYNSLQFLVAEQNLVWKNMAVHPILLKKKIIVQRSRGFSLSLLPSHLARNKENGIIEIIILNGCTPCTMILVYTLPAARKRFL